MCNHVLGFGNPVQLACKLCGELATKNYNSGLYRCLNKDCSNYKFSDGTRIKNQLNNFEWRDYKETEGVE